MAFLDSTKPEKALDGIPDWLPEAAQDYLAHVALGIPQNTISNSKNRAPSTISRRLRRIETKREDPLVDTTLDVLSARTHPSAGLDIPAEETKKMSVTFRSPIVSDEATINKEARRVLRRLCETGAFLAVAHDMAKSIVMRAGADGEQTRTAVLDREIAAAFALKDWIRCEKQGRVARYVITAPGRAALKRLIEEDRRRRKAAQADEGSLYSEQQVDWGAAAVTDDEGHRRPVRVNLAECPLAALARRKGADGTPFLGAELVQAGERLREDFERAQMGPRTGQNWDRFLTAGVSRGDFRNDAGLAEGPAAARARVAEAVEAMGPGLADIVMRVCCFLEGFETAERRLGWSARSGKVVLKIGLQRLLQHYRDRHGYVPALRD